MAASSYQLLNVDAPPWEPCDDHEWKRADPGESLLRAVDWYCVHCNAHGQRRGGRIVVVDADNAPRVGAS